MLYLSCKGPGTTANILCCCCPGLAGREHEDDDGGLPVPRRQQLRRDPLHPPLRQPCQEHHQQAQDQRGSQGWGIFRMKLKHNRRVLG